MTICDHKSVGVVIENDERRILLIQRGRYPIGFAPPAGHIDDHGSSVQAAVNETAEEVGLQLTPAALKITSIRARRVHNPCRRPGGSYHDWWVYHTTSFGGILRPSPNEVKIAGWYDRKQMQGLADRTQAYLAGRLPAAEWKVSPGLEPVWLRFLTELGYVA